MLAGCLSSPFGNPLSQSHSVTTPAWHPVPPLPRVPRLGEPPLTVAPALLLLGLREDYLINDPGVPGESLSIQRKRAPVPRRVHMWYRFSIIWNIQN